MIDKFTSSALRRRPDQTVFGLNQLTAEIKGIKSSLRIVSEDGSAIIVIGNQPMDPATKKPYGFGVRRYLVKGDTLVPDGELQWN